MLLALLENHAPILSEDDLWSRERPVLLTVCGTRIFVQTPDEIPVSGQHAFVPPNFNAGDQRGPCPALNSLANHGYIPHNGVTSVSDVSATLF